MDQNLTAKQIEALTIFNSHTPQTATEAGVAPQVVAALVSKGFLTSTASIARNYGWDKEPRAYTRTRQGFWALKVAQA